MEKEEQKCDICEHPDSTDPAMYVCDKHMEEATRPDPKPVDPSLH